MGRWQTKRLEEKLPEIIEGFLAAAEAMRTRTVFHAFADGASVVLDPCGKLVSCEIGLRHIESPVVNLKMRLCNKLR